MGAGEGHLTEGGWKPLHAAPDLMESDVHVWRAPLTVDDAARAALAATLSADETARAARYLRETDRRASVVSRGTLRGILAQYLGRAPRSLVFEVNEHGKPRLARPSSGLEFNVSHAGAHLLVAVALDRPVGVDVEDTRDDRDIELVAQRYFTHAERAVLDAVSDRRAAFFRVWSRKEAVLKARGTGFASDETAPDGFSVVDLNLDDDHAAAVATTDGPVRLVCVDYSASLRARASVVECVADGDP